jgi:predicted peptidase
MVEALEAAGAEVRFTPYPDVGHDSWTATYADPQLYEWLLAQRRP